MYDFFELGRVLFLCFIAKTNLLFPEVRILSVQTNILILVVWLSVRNCVFAQENNTLTTDSVLVVEEHKPENILSVRQQIVHEALQYIGKNYRRGGTGKTGFDCSGFTMMIYRRYGIRLPHTSAGQALMGNEIKLKQVQPGDLVFFLGRNRKSKKIGHVGIVISNPGEPVTFIHSSVGHGVRIDKVEYPYYKVRYLKAVRVIK